MKSTRNAVTIGIILIVIVPSLAYGTSFTGFNTKDNTFGSEMSVVLVTGFEPFDVYDVNPSQLIAEALNGEYINDAEIVGIVLPVDFDESVDIVVQAVEDYDPLLVISIGLAPGAVSIELEKIGVNLKIPLLNESSWLFPRRINPDGPFIRISSIDTREVTRELRESDIPVHQSFSAGIYVCNAVLYGTLGYIKDHELSTKAGFIHVPLLNSQDPNGMELETMIEAVKLSINISL